MLIKPTIHVLVVANDIAVMQKCRELLLNEGHSIRTAESTEEALDIIRRHPADVDLMLLSLGLPNDGSMILIETLQKARREIVILTISEQCESEAVEAMRSGAYDCIQADFSPDWFLVKVHRAIEVFRLKRQLGVLRRERQAALTEVKHDENFLAILNSLTDGFVVTDWQTNIVLFNEKASRLFDLTKEKDHGRPVSSCIKSDDLLSFFMRAIRADDSLATLMSGEEPIIKAGGKTLRVHVDPVRNEAGTPIGAVALFHDVTKVTAMDKLRADFLSMVSHELKAPLSSLLMQISVVHDGLAGELTDKQRELLAKAKDKTKGMITLVNDLLDYRRIEEGKSIQRIESLDCSKILQRTIELMRPSARDKEVVINTQIASGLPPFSGDRGGMEAIFVNIISNAIKYTPKGGNIEISLNQAGRDIRFKVVDSGIGIPPGDLDRIFEKFYRIKTEQTRRISGSGLGLSIVKGIVDAHNGSIHVESKVGKGTTFIVSLPVGE
ncbi:MAG: response regulator [Deltaproteobacteria bacterium]|nr:response regulator [Deltaproteobacteria bacterium]